MKKIIILGILLLFLIPSIVQAKSDTEKTFSETTDSNEIHYVDISPNQIYTIKGEIVEKNEIDIMKIAAITIFVAISICSVIMFIMLLIKNDDQLIDTNDLYSTTALLTTLNCINLINANSNNNT